MSQNFWQSLHWQKSPANKSLIIKANWQLWSTNEGLPLLNCRSVLLSFLLYLMPGKGWVGEESLQQDFTVHERLSCEEFTTKPFLNKLAGQGRLAHFLSKSRSGLLWMVPSEDGARNADQILFSGLEIIAWKVHLYSTNYYKNNRLWPAMFLICR